MVDLPATPSVRRRVASMFYEALPLLGILAVSAGLFGILLEQRHALYLRHLLQTWLFLVISAYFIWFWSHGGQTLPMKTWRIKLVAVDGSPVSGSRALIRYLLAWLWVLPGLILAWALGAKTWMLLAIPAVNAVLWGLAAHLHPQRQFLHDRWAGTRLIYLPPAKPDPTPKKSGPGHS